MLCQYATQCLYLCHSILRPLRPCLSPPGPVRSGLDPGRSAALSAGRYVAGQPDPQADNPQAQHTSSLTSPKTESAINQWVQPVINKIGAFIFDPDIRAIVGQPSRPSLPGDPRPADGGIDQPAERHHGRGEQPSAGRFIVAQSRKQHWPVLIPTITNRSTCIWTSSKTTPQTTYRTSCRKPQIWAEPDGGAPVPGAIARQSQDGAPEHSRYHRRVPQPVITTRWNCPRRSFRCRCRPARKN